MQFNVVPMTEVKTFAYYDLDIYRYFIGRPDQSMNMDNFVRNQNHHKKMIKWLIEYYTKKKVEKKEMQLVDFSSNSEKTMQNQGSSGRERKEIGIW